jgi:hypothetical protein
VLRDVKAKMPLTKFLATPHRTPGSPVGRRHLGERDEARLLGLLRSCRLASVSRSWQPVRTVRTVRPPSRTTRGASGASLPARASSAAAPPTATAPAMGPARAQKATHRRRCTCAATPHCASSPVVNPSAAGVWGCIQGGVGERSLCTKIGKSRDHKGVAIYWGYLLLQDLCPRSRSPSQKGSREAYNFQRDCQSFTEICHTTVFYRRILNVCPQL